MCSSNDIEVICTSIQVVSWSNTNKWYQELGSRVLWYTRIDSFEGFLLFGFRCRRKRFGFRVLYDRKKKEGFVFVRSWKSRYSVWVSRLSNNIEAAGLSTLRVCWVFDRQRFCSFFFLCHDNDKEDRFLYFKLFEKIIYYTFSGKVLIIKRLVYYYYWIIIIIRFVYY